LEKRYNKRWKDKAATFSSEKSPQDMTHLWDFRMHHLTSRRVFKVEIRMSKILISMILQLKRKTLSETTLIDHEYLRYSKTKYF
jgi:hypothetical protein